MLASWGTGCAVARCLPRVGVLVGLAGRIELVFGIDVSFDLRLDHCV